MIMSHTQAHSSHVFRVHCVYYWCILGGCHKPVSGRQPAYQTCRCFFVLRCLSTLLLRLPGQRRSTTLVSAVLSLPRWIPLSTCHRTWTTSEERFWSRGVPWGRATNQLPLSHSSTLPHIMICHRGSAICHAAQAPTKIGPVEQSKGCVHYADMYDSIC